MNSIVDIASYISLLLAFASIYLAYISFRDIRKSIETLTTVRSDLKNTSRETHELISKISVLFDAAKRNGLEMIYESRQEALASFGKYLNTDERITVVGSSLLGLLHYVSDFEHVVRRHPNRMVFLLTHPDESRRREGPEGRATEGMIRNEIIECIRKLSRWGVPLENIRLFKGSPTVFMIATPSRMLLNPYPYGIEAYHSFCIEVSADGTVFPQYMKKHFTEIWDSEWVEKAEVYLAHNNRLPPENEQPQWRQA